ncbi:MAG: dodecin domain-containing protein [Acidimicrobiales bacterium]
MAEAMTAKPANPAGTAVPRDPESVYQVIQLVGTDALSWEAAAAGAIAEAAKSINDLRVAQVVELDTVLTPDGIRAFRVRLKVSYRIDRRRLSATGRTEEVRRLLIVVNQTVGGHQLERLIAERAASGPVEFHVLVPAAMSKDYATARRLSSLGVDPVSGYSFTDLTPLTAVDEEGLRQAAERLSAQLDSVRRVDPRATGEVGDSDPMVAVTAVLARGSFDEIVVSTLHSSVSRWLRLDLPSRLERRFGLPVTTIEAEA